MKPAHSLIATTILLARTLARLLVIVLFLHTGFAQELTFNATAQKNPDQRSFLFETNFQVVETQWDAGVLFKDGSANRNFQLGQTTKKISIETDLSAVTYHRKQTLFSPALHWQNTPSKASGSKRLFKFLTGAALTGLGVYLLATSKWEINSGMNGPFSIYRVNSEGRTCIKNCPSDRTNIDWKAGAGVASLAAGAGFFYWGTKGN